MHLDLLPVHPDDFDALAELRLAAMRASLQALGRYDPARSRRRLQASFVPAQARHIVADARRIGFYVLEPCLPDWRLHHFYLLPEASGQGIGTQVLRGICERARQAGAGITLSALRGSRSQRFYQALGFVAVGQGEWDVEYRYPAPLQA